MDEAKAAHDDAALRGVAGQAVEMMPVRSMGVEMTENEKQIALGFFAKVGTWARISGST